MNKLEIKEVLVNLKNWDWDVKDYRMTKKEAETCIKALYGMLYDVNNVKKIEFWCYGKGEKINVCPICEKPIHFGAIGDNGVNVFHWDCVKKIKEISDKGQSAVEYADNPTLQNGA